MGRAGRGRKCVVRGVCVRYGAVWESSAGRGRPRANKQNKKTGEPPFVRQAPHPLFFFGPGRPPHNAARRLPPTRVQTRLRRARRRLRRRPHPQRRRLRRRAGGRAPPQHALRNGRRARHPRPAAGLDRGGPPRHLCRVLLCGGARVPRCGRVSGRSADSVAGAPGAGVARVSGRESVGRCAALFSVRVGGGGGAVWSPT